VQPRLSHGRAVARPWIYNGRSASNLYRKGRVFAAYLHLAHPTGEKSARTVASQDGLLIVDYGAAGRPVGVEITAPEAVPLERLNQLLAELGEPPWRNRTTGPFGPRRDEADAVPTMTETPIDKSTGACGSRASLAISRPSRQFEQSVIGLLDAGLYSSASKRQPSGGSIGAVVRPCIEGNRRVWGNLTNRVDDHFE
jgi:hypothetical protein